LLEALCARKTKPKTLNPALQFECLHPQVFGVILFCIALDVVTGVVTDFAIADEDKDCFGRDSRGSFLVTVFYVRHDSFLCAT